MAAVFFMEKKSCVEEIDRIFLSLRGGVFDSLPGVFPGGYLFELLCERVFDRGNPSENTKRNLYTVSPFDKLRASRGIRKGRAWMDRHAFSKTRNLAESEGGMDHYGIAEVEEIDHHVNA